MLHNLSGYFQSNAINELEGRYGAKLQAMPRRDIMAIIHALAECSYIVADGSESEYLGEVSAGLNGHEYEDSEIPEILNELDDEITDVSQALSLIQGLAAYASINQNYEVYA